VAYQLPEGALFSLDLGTHGAKMVRLVVALGLLFVMAGVRSETADVKYRGPVNLKTFTCTDTPQSSFVQRVCYDKVESYLLINLRGTFYHYCELPTATYDALMVAPSMGRFYNQNIKGSGQDGPYDCRTHRVPSY
jgi:KTSC domain-containing protein